MTPADLEIIKRRSSDLFPALASWIATLNSTQVQAHQRKWEACLLRFDRVDVNDTLDELATQPDSPWPWPADMERSAAIIAKVTSDRLARLKEARTSPVDALPKRPDAYKGSGIMSRVLNAIASDKRHVAGCAEFRAEFGRCVIGCPVPSLVGRELAAEDAGLEPDSQRFECHLCRDTGFVSCLAAADVVTTIRTGRVPLIRETYSVACSCQVGQQREKQGQREGRRPMERYDASRDVRALAADSEIVTTCRALRESWGGRRVAAFDEFNAGEF